MSTLPIQYQYITSTFIQHEHHLVFASIQTIHYTLQCTILILHCVSLCTIMYINYNTIWPKSTTEWNLSVIPTPRYFLQSQKQLQYKLYKKWGHLYNRDTLTCPNGVHTLERFHCGPILITISHDSRSVGGAH